MADKATKFNEEWLYIKSNVMMTFDEQLKEYVTSVNNSPMQYGLDYRLADMMKTLHDKTDLLIANIDTIKTNGTEFKNQFEKQLEDKKSFYTEQDKHEKAAEPEKSSSPSKQTLDEETVKEVKLGADLIRLTIKEKFLGRQQGKSRGESVLTYSSDNLTAILGATMIIILSYVSMQVHQ